MTKEKNEKEFIKTRQDSTIRRKVTRKKKVKFAILLDCLFICLFQLSYLSRPFREWICTSVELKTEILGCNITSYKSNWGK